MRTASALSLVLALAACSSPTDSSPADAGLTPVDAPVETDTGPPALYAPAGFAVTPFLSEARVGEFAAASEVLEDGVDYGAVIDTDAGRMVLDLTEVETPITVNSFVWLARHHFFDGIAFHRVIEGFMAQTGDPSSIDSDPSWWGTGGPGYQFGLEIDPALRFDGAGVLGMARADDPGTNGSQFFITFRATSHLDGMYTVFGRVVEGMDVLSAIQRGEPPSEPTRITRAYVIERAR